MIRIQLGLRCTKTRRNGRRCGRLRVLSRRRCPACLKFNRESAARATAFLERRNRCRTCRGEKENPFRQNCNACRKAATKRARARGLRMVALGKCRCGKVLKPGYKYCASCVAYDAKRNKRKSQQRAGFKKLKAQRTAWLAAGLCERCGAPAPNGTQCDPHLRDHAARQRKYEQRERLADD